MSMLEKTQTNLSFSGKESDQFVKFSLELLKDNINPKVIIIGREPITSTNIHFSGYVQNATWDGYKRTIEVLTEDNTLYLVGGSNSTKPIATTEVIFPNGIKNNDFGKVDLNEYISSIECGRLNETLLTSINIAIRTGSLSIEASEKISTCLIDSLSSYEGFIRREITNTFGLIHTSRTLKALADALSDIDKEVRSIAALRLRGLDLIIQKEGEDSELSNYVINKLCDRLKDKNEDADVKIYSAENLGYYYNDLAINQLFISLKDQSHEHIRWSSAVALGRTNSLEMPYKLIEALKTESSILVQQGILLSLGRLGRTINKIDLSHTLLKILCERAGNRDYEEIRDFIVYTLGELDNLDSNCLSMLPTFLSSLYPYQVRSNATLSITKQLAVLSNDEIHRTLIERELEKSLIEKKHDGWPESAYYKWFTIGAAELSSQLEKHGTSWKYYENASNQFKEIDWLSNYYKGVGFYEKAEYQCSQDDTYTAIEDISKALRLLYEVKNDKDFKSHSDKLGSGLEFKILLAEARSNMLSAYRYLSSSFNLGNDQLNSASKHFKIAYEKYTHIDTFSLSPETKKLSTSERELIKGLTNLIEFGQEIIELKKLSISLESEKLELLYGRIQQLVKSIHSTSKNTHSKSFKKLSDKLLNMISNKDKNELITNEVESFISKSISIFATPFPTPGTCPIYQFGHANLIINIPDSASGSGSQEDPYILFKNNRLIFESIVTVHDRTKNDELIFICANEPTNALEANNQEVPVHENAYKLRPIIYRSPPPSSVAIPYKFALEFRNQSCKHNADTIEVWIRIVVDLPTTTIQQQKKKLFNLEAQRTTLVSSRNELTKKLPKIRGDSSAEVKLISKIANLKSEIKKIEIKIDEIKD